jgi:hypothetical protein
MVDLDALRASISELPELMNALKAIPDANAMTRAQAIWLSQKLGRALAGFVCAGSNAVQDLVDAVTLYGNARRPPTSDGMVEPRRLLT